MYDDRSPPTAAAACGDTRAAEGADGTAAASAGDRAGTAGVSCDKRGVRSEWSSRAGEGGGSAGFSGAATASTRGVVRFVATRVRVPEYRTSPAPGAADGA